MFYEQASAALSSNNSEGWLSVSRQLNMSVQELQDRIDQKSLTFEQCIEVTRFAKSTELLIYVMSLFDRDFGFRGRVTHRGTQEAHRMN